MLIDGNELRDVVWLWSGVGCRRDLFLIFSRTNLRQERDIKSLNLSILQLLHMLAA